MRTSSGDSIHKPQVIWKLVIWTSLKQGMRKIALKTGDTKCFEDTDLPVHKAGKKVTLSLAMRIKDSPYEQLVQEAT